jgi:hypothetical protein
VRAHYLKSIRHPQQKHIYTLSRAAAPVLVEEGLAGPEFLNARSRAHELTPFFLKHEMMIVDVHAILEVAAKSSSVRLTSWREGRELHEPLTVTDQFGVAKVHFSPDAFFTLDDSARPSGASRRHFFLEADRSKETHPQFREKFRAYRHYLERGLHEDRFGIKNFRVLTITRTEERAKNLCATAQSYLPERWTWKYFLFSSLERFDLQNARPILEAVHLRPGDVRQHALMPPVNSDEVTVV